MGKVCGKIISQGNIIIIIHKTPGSGLRLRFIEQNHTPYSNDKQIIA